MQNKMISNIIYIYNRWGTVQSGMQGNSGTTIHLKYVVRPLHYFILSSIKHTVGTLQDDCIS